MADYKYCPRCGNELREAPRNDDPDRTYLVCTDEACGFAFYDNPTPVVAALVEAPDGTVVLIRNQGWPESWFGIVTGFLEKGEGPREAVLRELREELGVDGTIVGPIGEYDFEMMNQVIIAYHVRIDTTEVVPGAEIAAFKQVPVRTLRPWPMGTGHAVADWLDANHGPLEVEDGPEGIEFVRGAAGSSMAEICELYRAVGWTGHADQPEALQAALDGSHFVATARDSETAQLVGLLRVVSDGTWLAYLQEILVHPSYQRRGVGRALMEIFEARYGDLRQKVLLTDDRPEQHAFYDAFGFLDTRTAEPELHTFAQMPGLRAEDDED